LPYSYNQLHIAEDTYRFFGGTIPQFYGFAAFVLDLLGQVKPSFALIV
jgi:hypothetical protein